MVCSAPLSGKNDAMGTDSVEVFSAILSLVTLIAAVVSAVAMLMVRRASWASHVVDTLDEIGPWSVFVVTAGSMIGSLYFSEVANFAPCKLCWYQRIAMYSLAIISLVAALRRDRRVAPYLLVLSSIGFVVSWYHYLVEWYPSLESNVCAVDVPCTSVWFREFGFVTLSFMAGTAFLATITWSIAMHRAAKSPDGTTSPTIGGTS